jgi:hypothetical protein
MTQLLCVPDCPLVTIAKTTLADALQKYLILLQPSRNWLATIALPLFSLKATMLCVIRNNRWTRPACRLDLPTEEQIFGCLGVFLAVWRTCHQSRWERTFVEGFLGVREGSLIWPIKKIFPNAEEIFFERCNAGQVSVRSAQISHCLELGY